MSEKGDLPQDTDSLPPNYASSEVFTDSPPPAYRKTSTVRLQVTRVICFTILAAGFLTGVFILTHTWITNKTACDCQSVAPNAPLHEAAFLKGSSLPQVESLVGEEQEATENELESSQLDQESRQMDIPLPFEEDIQVEEDPLEIAEEAIEEEEHQLQDLVEEVQNKAKFPLDMILGNPQMAGKEVQCKVEKKMQNLGGGILSKTIIVTCDDENEDEEANRSPLSGLLGARPVPAPPMSILAPILKMMAARASARLQRQLQPKPSFRAFPQPFIQPVGMSVSGPFPQQPFPQQPFPAPFPFEGPAPHFEPHSHGDGPVHFHQHSGPMHHHHEMGQGPIAGPFPMSGNSISEPHMEHRHMPFIHHRPKPQQMREPQGPVHGSFVPFEGERDAPFREDFLNNRQPFPERIPEPTVRILPANNIVNEGPQEDSNPPPIKIFHGFPPQMPEALKQIVSRIMNRPENKELADRQPIIKIKALPEPGNEEEMPKSKLLLPLPVRAVKYLSRGARKLETNDDGSDGSIFPIPRGAISSGMKPHIVPEAAGRALDSPVALPSMSELPPLRFFPGKLLRIPVPIQGRAITHMEMKQNPNVVPIENKPIDEPVEQEEPNVPEIEREEGPDFGPPRRHTVIRAPPQMQDNISQESNLNPPFLRRFPPPPPPKFAREGRVGLIPEINPEAELVNPVVAEAKAHHMIMVN